MARPDIAFAISTWARFISNPTNTQQKGLKRLPRYLRNTTKKAIKYRNVKEHPHGLYNSLGLFAAVNASYASDSEERKSIIGYVIFMGGGPVIWRSHRQSLITKASEAAEYVATSEAINDLIWIRNFLTELGEMPEGLITMLTDSTAAKKWAENTAMVPQQRHIQLQYYAVKREIAKGRIRLKWVAGHENPADGFTKPLEAIDHERFVKLLQLEDF
jgi:hypothetical protein